MRQTPNAELDARHGSGLRAWFPGFSVPVAIVALSLAVFLSAYLVVGGRPAHSQTIEVSPEVLQAVRLLLSEDPKGEERGEKLLAQLGASALPQLRLWLIRVRQDVDRIREVVARLQGAETPEPLAERVTAGEFFSRKLVTVRSLVREGKYKEAQAIADAILLLDNKGPYAWELRRLARRAKEGILTAQVLEPSVDIGKLVYEVGEKPRILFRITNRDSRVARIRLDKGVLGEVYLTVTQQFMGGGMKIEKQRRRIEVSRDVEQILVGPGLVWDHPIDFDAKEGYAEAGMVARVQVAGRFRPTRWTVEGEEENISLPMNTGEFWIVPKGESEMCDSPLDKLTTALIFGKPESLFVSGQLAVWAGEEDAHFNESLVETLIGGLEDLSGPGLQLARRFLKESTGFGFEDDTEGWKTWWKKNQERRKAKRPRPVSEPKPQPESEPASGDPPP